MIVGLGTDVISIARFKRAWERHPQAFARRVFTEDEVTYCRQQIRPEQHLAARFAAKEAALKALGTGWAKGLAFTDAEVVRDQESGRPSLLLHGKARELAARLGVTASHLSYSHTADYATATVVLEGGD